MLSDSGKKGCCIDIAILIDATENMALIINEVKANAMDLCAKFQETMKQEMAWRIDEFRVKVIPFRDYAYDGAQAMNDSGFFFLPEQNAAFRSYMDSIVAKGGGDGTASALEAMALAMRSDWTTKGDRRRHIILVFTNSSAVPLKEASRTKNPYYPDNMPTDLNELYDMWSKEMPEKRSKRLAFFAPKVEPWCDDMEKWEMIWPEFSNGGSGLDEAELQMVTMVLSANV